MEPLGGRFVLLPTHPRPLRCPVQQPAPHPPPRRGVARADSERMASHLVAVLSRGLAPPASPLLGGSVARTTEPVASMGLVSPPGLWCLLAGADTHVPVRSRLRFAPAGACTDRPVRGRLSEVVRCSCRSGCGPLGVVDVKERTRPAGRGQSLVGLTGFPDVAMDYCRHRANSAQRKNLYYSKIE